MSSRDWCPTLGWRCSQAGYGFYWSIWWAMYWASQDDESVQRPWLSEMSDPHPALQAWTEAWNELLKTPKGREIKAGLDRFMPKSQVIIARKPGWEAGLRQG